MSQLAWALRHSGAGILVRLGSQQVARRNAASAAASLLQRRQEREAVDAFLAQSLQLRPAARAGTAS